jgi:membrane protease YdiL (CAAX protease family)
MANPSSEITSVTLLYKRYMHCLLFVAVYICLGFLFRFNTQAYLLLGIPLTLLFQSLIARKPFYVLWLREENKFHLSKRAFLFGACFLVYPLYKTVALSISGSLTLVNLGYYSAAIAGAFAAGICFAALTKRTWRSLLLCFSITLLLRISLYFLPFITGKQILHINYIIGIQSLLTYIPVAFIVEEVVFRGLLDTHIWFSEKTNGSLSAFFISMLWGLWHLPLSANGGNPVWFAALGSMTISIWGMVLSIFWRRSGNLAVPVFSHAFADAVRDAVK